MAAPRGTARLLGRFRGDRRGSVAVMAIGFGACMIACAALSVDVASVYLAKRREQGALDLAALAAARDLTNADHAARVALAANGVATPRSLVVTLGAYVADPALAPDKRFRANATPLNAVRLEMRNEAQLYFGRAILGSGTLAVGTRATAVNTRVAAFSIGSRLASLNGGVANALLSGLLGASVSLDVMDYDALASLDVDMPTLLNALAQRVGVTAGTYDQVLSATPTVGDLAASIVDAAGANATARTALSKIVSGKSTNRVDLRQLLSLGPFANLALGTTPGVSASASALDVLGAAIGVSNGGRQVDIDLGVQVPSLLGLKASVTVGERPQGSPWLAIGQEGVTVRTAQTRVRLVAQVAGAGGLPGVRLPIAIDVASGVAELASASCGTSPRSTGTVSLAVTPSVADIWVGEPSSVSAWNDFSTTPNVGPATVLDALLVKATASAHVAATNLRPTRVDFSADDIARNAVKTVQTTDVAQSTLTSLTQNLDLSVKLLGITLGTPQAVTATLSALLSPLGATLDPTLNALLRVLGVGVGQADVTVRGLRCDGSTLVG